MDDETKFYPDKATFEVLTAVLMKSQVLWDVKAVLYSTGQNFVRSVIFTEYEIKFECRVEKEIFINRMQYMIFILNARTLYLDPAIRLGTICQMCEAPLSLI